MWVVGHCAVRALRIPVWRSLNAAAPFSFARMRLPRAGHRARFARCGFRFGARSTLPRRFRLRASLAPRRPLRAFARCGFRFGARSTLPRRFRLRACAFARKRKNSIPYCMQRDEVLHIETPRFHPNCGCVCMMQAAPPTRTGGNGPGPAGVRPRALRW